MKKLAAAVLEIAKKKGRWISSHQILAALNESSVQLVKYSQLQPTLRDLIRAGNLLSQGKGLTRLLLFTRAYEPPAPPEAKAVNMKARQDRAEVSEAGVTDLSDLVREVALILSGVPSDRRRAVGHEALCLANSENGLTACKDKATREVADLLSKTSRNLRAELVVTGRKLAERRETEATGS